MDASIDRLLSLRVADVMNRYVVQVSAHDTMAQAAAQMTEHHVSGAPVVDETNRCVGVLSAIDFMRREKQTLCCDSTSLPGKTHRLEQITSQAVFAICDVNEDLVERHMTTAVQSISAGSSLTVAGHAMCRAHVHRLPVIEPDGRVVGIISSLDIVAAVVNAVAEMKS